MMQARHRPPTIGALSLARIACTGLLPVATLLAAAAPQEPPGSEPTSATSEADPGATSSSPRRWIRGQLRTRYYARWTADVADHDLVSVLSLDLGDENEDAYTAHLMGRVTWDLDDYDSEFASLNDSYGRDFDALLYDAWIDVHNLDVLPKLRIGRQSLVGTPEMVWFDGIHAETTEIGPAGLLFGGYVGATTHLYEAAHTGDLVAGGYAAIRPWEDGRVRVDYMHLEDDARLLSHENQLLGASFRQRLGRMFRFEADYSRLGGKDRDVRGRLYFQSAEADLFIRASYYELLEAQGDLVLEADPFFNALNELRPYNQRSVMIGKGIGEHLQLQAAADMRRVQSSADIGFYNRDYDHFYGTVGLTDVCTEGLTLSGTVDSWDSDSQTIHTWGADLGYTIDATRISIGTYYSLYKFDLLANTERDHVRTYYCKLRHKASESLTFDGDYELEDTDSDQYHRFRMGVTWRF